MPSIPLEERFWQKVDKSAGPDACWPWMRAKGIGGYGLTKAGKRKHLRAHRLAWELTYGSIPAGMWVLHRCDNPPCCNPSHLWLGTHQDNMDDRRNKGRYASGEKHAMAKLTQEQVDHIRALYATGGYSQHTLARIIGTTRATIQAIVSRRNW